MGKNGESDHRDSGVSQHLERFLRAGRFAIMHQLAVRGNSPFCLRKIRMGGVYWLDFHRHSTIDDTRLISKIDR